MKIIENFLTKEEFEPIQSYFFYKLPWMYWDSIVGNMGDEKEDKDFDNLIEAFAYILTT